MNRGLSIVARVAGWIFAVVGVVAVGVTAAVLLVDPNDYKDRLIDAVQDATGRTLTLGGDLRLTRSLWPTLTASDISLSNLPGGSRPQMVHVERIEGQLSLLSLLRREIDVMTLTLIGPNILFEQANGAPNWVFTGAAPSPATPAPSTPAPAEPGDRFQLRVRAAHVRNGMVTWKLPARTKVVGIRLLDFARPTADGPIQFSSTLVYADNKPFDLDVTAQPTGGVMDPWQTQLKFAAFDAAATAQGTLAVAGAYDLLVEGTAGSLEKLNALLPEMKLPAVKQAVLSARIGNGAQPGDLPVLGATTLRFASADLRDRVPGLTLGATSVVLPKAGGTASVDSSGQYAGTGFRLTGGVGVPTHPDGKVSVPIDLTMATAKKGDGSLALKGTVALEALQFAGLDAGAVMTAEALAGLRPALGAGLPALTGVRFEGQVSVPAAGGAVRLRKVELTTEQGDLAGDGTVELDATPVITGHWTSDRMDMDAMLSAFGIDLSGSGPSAATGPMIPNTRLPWATLRGPSVDVTTAIAAMDFQGEVWRDVQAAVSLKKGRMQASPVSVAMPGTRMQASLTLDAAGAASVALTAPAIPWALVARYAGVPGPVSGTLAVEAQLRAQGQTMHDLAATLTGPFSMTARDGRLSNRALVGLTGPALEALSITVPAAGETRLACFGLIGSFTAGIGTFKTIALETSYLSLDGAGQVDLGRELVALKLQPMAQVVGSRVSVPVVVQGPFRNVSGALAADGLDKLGFLIDGLFGGDRSTACAAVPR